MIEDEPNLVTSGKSQHVIIDGFPFSIEIYRLEQDKSKRRLQAIEAEGAIAFMRGDNVIPFRKN